MGASSPCAFNEVTGVMVFRRSFSKLAITLFISVTQLCFSSSSLAQTVKDFCLPKI